MKEAFDGGQSNSGTSFIIHLHTKSCQRLLFSSVCNTNQLLDIESNTTAFKLTGDADTECGRDLLLVLC